MNYIQNKLDTIDIFDYIVFEDGDIDKEKSNEKLKELFTDYHNHTLEKLLKHFNDLESKDTDDSMNNWRNYKFIRNNIVDCLQDTNPKE